MRLHFTTGCYDYRRLHDFVKVSISASLKSFLLIMCIDAPESTTNSLSSGLRFDGAGRHLFSEGKENTASFFSINFRMLSASLHTASRAHRSCHSVSSWDRSSYFWSVEVYADEDRLGKSFRAKDFGLECLHDVRWLFVNWTHRIGFRMFGLLPQNRWRVRRLHILKHATQLPCARWSTSCRSSFQLVITFLTRSPWSIVTTIDNRFPYTFMPITLLQHSHCTFVTILWNLLLGCSSTWRCAWEHFSPNLHPRTSILEGATFHRMEWCKFHWGNPCTAVEPFSHLGFASRTPGSRCISLILPRRR